jgi:pilus assembly protein CpaF
MATMLKIAARCRLNILISGGTGSGKTTLLNALSRMIDSAERTVTIEDAAELQLQQPHVVRMETRPANAEGRGEMTQRDLIKNALRMRPDRIIMGEVRAGEAFDMLQAMNTGHDGSMSTIHANSPRDALLRLEQMIGMAAIEMSPRTVRSQIVSAIHVVMQLGRGSDGKRRLLSVQEMAGLEGDMPCMNELFRFVRTSTDSDGRIHGYYMATGIRPRFAEALASQGIALPPDLFQPNRRVE